MAVIGYVYALLDRALNRPAAGEGGMAILAAMMLAPNAIESSTAASFGSLVQNIAALALLLLPFRSWKHAPPATSSSGARRRESPSWARSRPPQSRRKSPLPSGNWVTTGA